MNQYLAKTDSLLETCAPLKKLNKKEVKFLAKSWITQGLQNSIKGTVMQIEKAQMNDRLHVSKLS